MAERELALRKRVARQSAAAAGLGLLAVGFVAVALLIVRDLSFDTTTGYLPVNATYVRPGAALLIAASIAVLAVLMGFAAAQTAAGMRVLARDRRIPAPLPPALRRMRSTLLGPHAVAAVGLDAEPQLPGSALPAGAPEDSGKHLLRLTVVIPAYNEELTIKATLTSLWAQTRPPDRVLVVADNCADGTVAIAGADGADVFETVGNSLKKAGALNQALDVLLPQCERRDVVMVMDADSIIVPDFLSTALDRLEADPDLIGVGGVFFGEDGCGLVGQLQRDEFARYQRYIGRRRGKVFVLTGTAALIRGYALSAVADARGSLIPGVQGAVYDTLAMTEDNEMTLALKTLGAKLVSPKKCKVITEVMPSWRALWRQRMRWQRGALENIGAYGLTRTTALYWGQQLGIGYGTIALNAYLLLMLITVLSADGIEILWFWALIGCIFVVERVVTVWDAGWRGRALALPLVIEIGYDLFLQAVFLRSLLDIATGRASGWNHVPRQAESQR
ncbi:glycosyltransferase family 2 protein [Jatrophihabitans sp. DSM 45814]